MEIRLRKLGFYGFVLGMGIAILFVNYKEVTSINDFAVTTTMPIFEYIVTILRFSFLGMFLGIFIGWYSYEKKHEKEEGKVERKKTYYIPFFIGCFLFSCIFIYVFNF